MAKNIVICCDGTGNEVSGDLSNVLKLFRIAIKSDKQRVFYDPGVGTIGIDQPWARLRAKAKAVFGLATGAGLDANIVDAYRFLVETWEQDDRIYLFGFSRGAYTVRALAGFIHMVGLLRADQLNLCDYALTAYKRANEIANFHVAWDFGRVVGSRRATIHFIGAWDTVASMIVPRPDRFYIPSLRTLPYTRANPSVRAFRHARAIDERRRMFRLNTWAKDTQFVIDPFSNPPKMVAQDVDELWFAGVHADIGGGYPEAESGLSKFPLIWIVEGAEAHGLLIDRVMFSRLAKGQARAGANYAYVPPDAAGPLHRSLKGAWWLLEWLPKSGRWREWPKRRILFGHYLPRGEPRYLGPSRALHSSVQARIAQVPNYRPVNV